MYGALTEWYWYIRANILWEKPTHVYILTNPLVICLVPTAKLNFMSCYFSECLLQNTNCNTVHMELKGNKSPNSFQLHKIPPPNHSDTLAHLPRIPASNPSLSAHSCPHSSSCSYDWLEPSTPSPTQQRPADLPTPHIFPISLGYWPWKLFHLAPIFLTWLCPDSIVRNTYDIWRCGSEYSYYKQSTWRPHPSVMPAFLVFSYTSKLN